MRSLALLFVAIVNLGVFGQARPPAPPPPEKVDIEIRYRIDAFRNDRARQFNDFVDRLKELGFERDAEDDRQGELNQEIENVAVTRMKGTMPSAKARAVLNLRPVLGILIRPAGAALPMGDRTVRVDLELAGDLVPSRQRVLADELSEVLRKIGFRQPLGYDHRGYRRLLGVLPAGQLETILNDVRRAPASWSLLPKTLLNDVRKAPGGSNALRAVLEAWNDDAEGGKLILAILEAWVTTEPAYRMISELPALVIEDTTLMREVKLAVLKSTPIDKDTRARLVDLVRGNEVIREQLLKQIQISPRSDGLLDKLFADVLKSPAGPKLIDILLRRIEGREAALALPQLFRSRILVRVIEVRPELPQPEPRLPSPAAHELTRVQPALREVIKDMAQANTPRRMDVVLNFTPNPNNDKWEELIDKAAPSLVIEGRFGPLLSVRCKPSEVPALSKLPIVAAVRLPREAKSTVLRLPDEEGDEQAILKSTGIDALIRKGKPDRPVRVAVIDSDFRGWQELVRKKLPASTRLLDLTAERNDNLKADPHPGPANVLGNGTLIALAVAKAAPWCELLLVRIDAGSPHMVRLVHGRLHGRTEFGDSLLARRFAITQGRNALNNRYQAILKERTDVLKLFADNRNQSDEQLKQRQTLMDEYRKKHDQYDLDEKAYDELERQYLQHLTNLRDLRDVRIVVCGLTWNDSLPSDGGSALSRLLDDTQGSRFLWIQPVGNARSQTWTGFFRDADGNRAMEFADENVKLPAGNWSHEAAFLAWEPTKGQRAAVIPAKTKVRITLQWREAHDAEFNKSGDDPFKLPLHDLRLLVIKQTDPEGKTRPADDLTVVTETVGPPQRIAVEENSGVYEHILETTIDPAGRVALRVEGVLSQSTRPRGTLELPMDRKAGELKLRIFIETLDGDGRVIFDSHLSKSGEIGVPADASRSYTVGATDAKGKPRPYSIDGSAFGLELSRKPELLTFDRLGMEGAKNVGGTGMSAGLVGGYAASLLANGTRWEDLLLELRQRLQKRE